VIQSVCDIQVSLQLNNWFIFEVINFFGLGKQYYKIDQVHKICISQGITVTLFTFHVVDKFIITVTHFNPDAVYQK